jgi:ribosomal protein L37AE/L43A
MSWRSRYLDEIEKQGVKPEFNDPTGSRFGTPTFPYRFAPKGLLTRRQLRAANLAPGGHDPVAQILWKHRGGLRTANLYDAEQAVPKRVPTEKQLQAVRKALVARMTCKSCGDVKDYCIPTSLGECPECHEGARGATYAADKENEGEMADSYFAEREAG